MSYAQFCVANVKKTVENLFNKIVYFTFVISKQYHFAKRRSKAFNRRGEPMCPPKGSACEAKGD